MANTRLPRPGGDRGNWGDVLNAFLKRAHNEDGTLKDTGVLAEKYKKPTSGIPESDLAAGVQTKLNNGAPDADTDTKGVIKLGGDVGGTADNPTVPGLAAKLDSSGGEMTGGLTGNFGSGGSYILASFFNLPVMAMYNQH